MSKGSTMKGRGQTLVLMALTMLLVVLMVCMTLGIASRAKAKAELQTLSDAAAFTNAVAVARTYNTTSLMNRTMVSHYAAMAAIQAEIAWVTLAAQSFGIAAGYFRMFEAPSPAYAASMGCWSPGQPPPSWYGCEYYYYGSACSARTAEVRDAASELWHAGLAYWNPRNGPTHDDVNKHCTGSAQYCDTGRNRVPVGIATLDKEAAEQVKDLHQAVIDLARVERGSWNQLQNVVEDGVLTKRMILMAQGKNPKANAKTISDAAIAPYKVWAEKDFAWKEVDRATAHQKNKPDSFKDPIAEAVMGTRNDRFVIEYNSDGLAPVMQAYFNEAVVQNLMNPAVWPAGKFSVSFQTNADPRGVFAKGTYPAAEMQMKADETIGMNAVVGDASINISVSYRDACTGTLMTNGGISTVHVQSGANNWEHNSGHCGGPPHAKPGWPNDHGNHVHYFEEYSDIHKLDDELFPERAVGYVFPTKSTPGGRGAWGAPKMPVMLTRSFPNPDPWELDFRFRFSGGGKGTRLDLKGGSSALPKLMALSNGITYYHRRGAVGEPPNMLNPFWHGTLVPQEVDEHGAGAGDKTPGAREKDELKSILNKMGEPEAAKAYTALKNAKYTGIQ